jgi:uncharacterized protein YjbJ (UPF0337 family)
MMGINAQVLQGQWNTLRDRVKERWGQLTDDDLSIAGGNLDQLVSLIQQKTGEGREAIEKFLTDLVLRGSTAAAHAAEAAGHYAHQAGDRLRERSGRAEEMIRQNPAQAVFAAFGMGLVAGLILGLALRSR